MAKGFHFVETKILMQVAALEKWWNESIATFFRLQLTGDCRFEGGLKEKQRSLKVSLQQHGTFVVESDDEMIQVHDDE